MVRKIIKCNHDIVEAVKEGRDLQYEIEQCKYECEIQEERGCKDYYIHILYGDWSIDMRRPRH